MSAEIAEHHLAMLAASGITVEFAQRRGYETITDRSRLAALKITKAGRNVPGLLVPQLRAESSTWGHQYRPDNPRLKDGKLVKYETPWQQRNGIDIPPGVGDQLGDPAVPLFITEGVKKADCGALHGLCIVALSGVWNWLHTNSAGGKLALPEFRDIALNGRRVIMAFDGDVARKPSVRRAMDGLAAYLATKGARVEYLHLPDTDDKTGLDDHLVNSHNVDDLWRLVKPTPPPPATACSEPRQQTETPKPPPVQPVSLDSTLTTFNRWLHIDDPAPVLAVAATVVANLADGDPVWLLVVGPPSSGKTEILQSCAPLLYMVPRHHQRSRATVGHIQTRTRTRRHRRAATASRRLRHPAGQGLHQRLVAEPRHRETGDGGAARGL